MTLAVEPRVDRVSLSRSQQNMYNGASQADDPRLYLIGKSYRLHPIEGPVFMSALEAAVVANAVQLCVLEQVPGESRYPELVRRLQFGDIVQTAADTDAPTTRGADELVRMWSTDLEAKPLVRYTVHTETDGRVVGLDIHAHHLLLDGGAIAVIETDLGQRLAGLAETETPCPRASLAKISEAHSREATKTDESLRRFGQAVQRELADASHTGGYGHGAGGGPVGAARGVLRESFTLSGKAFEKIETLSEAKQVPLNILVAAAAIAVDASLRQSTATLLIHAVDNRFAEPDLNVATCLVNSIAHPVRFPAFASVQDVVHALDRDYVRASRRRWFREEQYRRMYLAINKTSHVEALTFNFIRETCAPALRLFLSAAPYATDIGPVEGMTVSCVVDEEQRTLTLSIWNRADVGDANTPPLWMAERIAAALGSMEAMWHLPIAMTVNEWFGIGVDGTRRRGDECVRAEAAATPAWFLDADGGVDRFLRGRQFVEPWIAWLVAGGVAPGDIVVCVDDDTDKTVDLLIACHLAGCGYSVCESAKDMPLRADSITEHDGGAVTHVVDTAAPIPTNLDGATRRLVEERTEAVVRDAGLATRTAYIMATSGSTGRPKLVPVTHGALALFARAAANAYGWEARDSILQCAPLTSDISVEEIFCGAVCGLRIVRSAAMKSGDLDALVRDIQVLEPTLIDLPTAVWHLLCDDAQSLASIGCSALRQVVVGGEAIRPSAVDTWLDSAGAQGVSLISSYGPTETTVVVTYLPIDGTRHGDSSERLRVGLPVVPNTVFVAFGEIVVVGETVSAGYLGTSGDSFGVVRTADGASRRAFATADRVVFDEDGFPAFSGRRDAIVKISGRRIDTAAIVRRVGEEPGIADAGVGVHRGALVVWFQARKDLNDNELATRIRRLLVDSGVSSFFVVSVSRIPRKPNGKIDDERLRTMPQFVDAAPDEEAAIATAAGLARIWSRYLGREIRAESSLLAEGIGSLDLIRILPDTRRYLGRQLSVLDVISADSAAYLAAAGAAADQLGAADTACEIGADLERLTATPRVTVLNGNNSRANADGPIVVLGASGIVGTGFARATVDLKSDGALRPDVVLVTRSELPDSGPWPALRAVDGVRVQHVGTGFGPQALDTLMRENGARTLVNCIGNTNMLAPYRDIRDANVQWVSAAADICAARDARLIHMSTFVVNAEVDAARVTDPREALYPYAASKALAELVVAASPRGLDFTLARLPRVLGEAGQLVDSADVLVSIVDACIALRACPSVSLTEEVTTGYAAATSILGMAGEPSALGRGITVVRGMEVRYAEFLAGFGLDELELSEWKQLLDGSDWAKRNPRRWSVIDAWAGLGLRLGSQTYADHLARYPTISLDAAVSELGAVPESIRDLLVQGCSQ
ncbi:peptide synthase [Mycobacteroides chelonae]|uniref:AMP-binding protein n=1 Tax=Mycobacteroides chelonae TaxID=1774 RepID=UPI0008A95269|nr:AMP-binding protein [Mycobacteroides chelonae]MBF9519961.1 AMP-binding protein [Mycobacteroides chelonae]OHU55523.1 peptide synthase [Mycobacteroides chelonae]PKQ58004.1 peptide synthase [Mycobacterium sp. MHSD3]SKO65777.1 Probable cyclic synthetase (peptide synthase) [Mycobacteroides abscessus subsp. bolletii]